MSLPAVYLSGGFSLNKKKERELIERAGCKYRCYSFAFISPEGFHYSNKMRECFDVAVKKKISVMLDSGCYSIHPFNLVRSKTWQKLVATGKAPTIEQLQKKMYIDYTTFIKKEFLCGKDSFYVTLDFRKNQPLIYRMQKRFLRSKLSPMPVYHGDAPLHWLDKYKDMGHNYIAIGTIKRDPKHAIRYREKIFDYGAKHGLEFHGLAATNMKTIVKFPWKSVDSSSWTQSAAYGMVIMPDAVRNSFTNIHVSNKRLKSETGTIYRLLPRKARIEIAGILKDHGFDIKKMENDTSEREVWNAYVFSNLDKFQLSTHSGIRWESLL